MSESDPTSGLPPAGTNHRPSASQLLQVLRLADKIDGGEPARSDFAESKQHPHIHPDLTEVLDYAVKRGYLRVARNSGTSGTYYHFTHLGNEAFNGGEPRIVEFEASV